MKTNPAYPSHVEHTSQTDDQRIKDITVLPPPEHLIRFFPIQGTPAEKLITQTRKTIHHIMHGKDDRLLVVIGPCSIHDPAAASSLIPRSSMNIKLLIDVVVDVVIIMLIKSILEGYRAG